MALHAATDADYNAASRSLSSKVEIYFETVPLEVTKDNYLIDWDGLEEVGSDSSNNPIGDTSANEFTFALLNENRIFSPNNISSPYYGKIKAGVKVIPYIRTSESDWVQLGIYYVNDWTAAATSLQATVFCYDKLEAVFSGTPARPPAKEAVTFAQAYQQFMSSLGLTTDIDSSLTKQLAWWYPLLKNKDTLQKLSAATLAGCFCTKSGQIKVSNFTQAKTLRATITDNDQVVSANVNVSLVSAHDGAQIALNTNQLSDMVELLSLKDLTIVSGTTNSQTTLFSATPVVRIELTKLQSDVPNLKVDSFIATPYDIRYKLENPGVDAAASLLFMGRNIEISKSEFYKSGNNPLTSDNQYVQATDTADLLRQVYVRFASHPQPYLDLSFRGNPLLNLGDKVRVISDKYYIDFTGYILRMKLSYTGALKGSLRLIAASILEVT